MLIKDVSAPEFAPYGKVVDGYELSPLLDALGKLPMPDDSVVYIPGEPTLEALPVKNEIANGFFGGMPVQIGYCGGHNKKLNCLEYHRDSELIVTVGDIVLLVAKLEDVRDFILDTSLVEAFFVPAGRAVQLYETTLHYAPCSAPGGDGFRVAVVLPLGTNTDKPEIVVRNTEDKLLWARNKWLIAHPESPEATEGANVGLTGENIAID